MGKTAASATAIERRVQAWELRKSGLSYRAIAKKLEVSHEQIRKDCQAVYSEFSNDALKHAEEWRTLQLERCEDMIVALWPAAQHGDVDAVKALLQVFKRQAALLGMDAPQRMEHSGPDGAPIEIDERITLSQDERDSRILTIVERARERSNLALAAIQPDLATPDGAAD